MVKQYKGAYSGEHGDGLVRSEWIAPFFGPRLTAALGRDQVLARSARPDEPRQDRRALEDGRRSRSSAIKPGYKTHVAAKRPRLERVGRLRQGRRDVQQQRPLPQVRRRDDVPVVPRHAATKRTSPAAAPTRCAWRSRTSSDAEADEAVKEALDLCVSCKGCKRECPTGVDMARMKIEFLAHYKAKHGHSLRDRAIAYLPRYAPWAAPVRAAGQRRSHPWASHLSASAAARAAALARATTSRDRAREAHGSGREVVLFVDTFNRYFEPENARAAVRVLEAAGYSVQTARPLAAGRPLCCGRTFLTAGMVDEARTEARRTARCACARIVERGVPVSASSRRACFRCATSTRCSSRTRRPRRCRRIPSCSRNSSPREPGALQLQRR